MTGPKLEDRAESMIAYVEHMGPYDKVPWPEYMEKLYGWAKVNRVMPGFYPMAIYHNAPETTPPGELRSDIAISFKGPGKAKAGVKTRKLPKMKVATVSHKAPGSEFKNTYTNLMEWIGQKGYEVSGPPIEIYSKRPEVKGGVTIIYAKIMIPVKRK